MYVHMTGILQSSVFAAACENVVFDDHRCCVVLLAEVTEASRRPSAGDVAHSIK